MQKYATETENTNFPDLVLPNRAYTLSSMALDYASAHPHHQKLAFLVADKARKGLLLDDCELACLRAMLRAYQTLHACEAWKAPFFEAITGKAYLPARTKKNVLAEAPISKQLNS